jgi:hypothetical protein
MFNGEKHLDTNEGGSYINISLFEGEVRPGKARQPPMGYRKPEAVGRP